MSFMAATRHAFRSTLGHSLVVSTLFGLGAPLAAHAATLEALLSYDFDVGSSFSPLPEAIAEGLSVTGWTIGAGSLSDAAGNPGRALSATGWADGNAYLLRVSIEPGRTLLLSGFGFDERASATGATLWELSIDGSSIASGASHQSYTRHAGAMNLDQLGGQFDIVLRGFGGSSNSGTWRIDNFYLEGQLSAVAAVPAPALAPVPLPAALPIYAAGLGGLLLRGRRAGRASRS